MYVSIMQTFSFFSVSFWKQREEKEEGVEEGVAKSCFN